jgi:hypothetical protein
MGPERTSLFVSRPCGRSGPARETNGRAVARSRGPPKDLPPGSAEAVTAGAQPWLRRRARLLGVGPVGLSLGRDGAGSGLQPSVVGIRL